MRQVSFSGQRQNNQLGIRTHNLVAVTSLGALHGVSRVLNYKEIKANINKSPKAYSVLDPFDEKFFNFISKSKLGKNLCEKLTKTNGNYINLPRGYRIDPVLLAKGASFGALIYLIPKLIIAGIKQLESKIEK